MPIFEPNSTLTDAQQGVIDRYGADGVLVYDYCVHPEYVHLLLGDAGRREVLIDRSGDQVNERFRDHDCAEHAVEVQTEGALGHGWECGRCGMFLQAG